MTLGAPYVEATGNVGRKTNEEAIKKCHDKMFKPVKVVKESVKAPYEHKTDLEEKKKVYRNEDGEVVIGPKNFLTNPLKHG